MTLFEQILHEASKERFILPFYTNGIADKYSSLGIPSKEDMVKFYNTHDVGIDWNKKKDEAFFEDLLYNMQNFSSKSSKKKDANQLFKRDDCVVLGEDENWIYVMPLSYQAAKFMDSFECGGDGAKWCIGWEQSDQYWNNYNKFSIFVLMFNKLGTKSVKNDLKYMVQFDCEESLTNPEICIWNQPDSEISSQVLDIHSKFKKATLKQMYQKAYKLQLQMYPEKFLTTKMNFDFNTTQEMIQELSNYQPKVTPKKALKRYKYQEDYNTIVIHDGVDLQSLRFLYNRLRELKIDLSDLDVSCSVLTINDNYDNDNFKDLKLTVLNRVHLDAIAAKTLGKLKLVINTVRSGCVLVMKLPLNYALTHDVKKIAASIFNRDTLSRFKILAEVNTSVREKGLAIDGLLDKTITVDESNKDKYFYNCNLDVSGLEVEDIKNLKTINSKVVKY